MKSLCLISFSIFLLLAPICPSQVNSVPAPGKVIEEMEVADGFAVELVASEPMVRQPVAIDFDQRGRLWVIQYLQYPNPAGLKRVQVDRYSRTKYDQVPPPPPSGPRGDDRITILEDTNGDGQIDQAKDFVSGLNLASGFAFGADGLFVLNAPYLLFYADRNRDDIPDGPPEVLLSGFGIEDAHSVANSLTIGPDGWLYGCQGSTVTANINGIEFQQGVWRFHPVRRVFELFCEGGGNSWGLDFDRHGQLYYSTNFGGYVLLHAAQGGYFVKSFAKHGELHNPFAFGYFEHATHDNFQGGHVTVGGIVYQGDLFPATFRDRYIAGDLLGHGVRWHHIDSIGATVKTRDGGSLIRSVDPSFAPSDLVMGPDGSIYVSDWSDLRTAHPDPDADWDRSNGRIYRILPKSAKGRLSTSSIPAIQHDLETAADQQLLAWHSHSNQWIVRRSRQELIRRYRMGALTNLEQLIAQLRRTTLQADEQEYALALECLWTLYNLNGLDEGTALPLLDSPNPYLRMWCVRLLGDEPEISDTLAHRLDAIAEVEPAIEVRAQLASTAARLPAYQAMPIINANINRDIDSEDARMPLLWWWAVERHSVSGREEVLKRFVRPTLWKSKLGRDRLLPKLIQRYAAEDSTAGWEAIVRLIESVPSDQNKEVLWQSILNGWRRRERSSKVSGPPYASTSAFLRVKDIVRQAAQNSQLMQSHLWMLGVEWEISEVLQSVRAIAEDNRNPAETRATMLNTLARSADPQWIAPLMQFLDAEKPIVLRQQAIASLAYYDRPEVAQRLIELLSQETSKELRNRIIATLIGRQSSAKAMLQAVDQGTLRAEDFTVEQIRPILHWPDPSIPLIIQKHWGRMEPATREESLAEVRRLNNDLRAGEGDAARGRELFQKHCALCHTMFGEGKRIGPDLTSANRQDRDFLLISLVDPSSVVRKEYATIQVQTHDGRVFSGMPATSNESDATIALTDSKGETITLSRAEVAETKPSRTSIMPDNLYRQLKPQELRDLFRFLQQ